VAIEYAAKHIFYLLLLLAFITAAYASVAVSAFAHVRPGILLGQVRIDHVTSSYILSRTCDLGVLTGHAGLWAPLGPKPIPKP